MLDVYCPILLNYVQCFSWYARFQLSNWKWCQCLRICANFYCPYAEMMSVFELICWMYIVHLLIYDVSVWEYVLHPANFRIWPLDFYCPTVEMMSVCDKMCSISIVRLLKWFQCVRICVWEYVLVSSANTLLFFTLCFT